MLAANQNERLWIPAFAGMTSHKINRDGIVVINRIEADRQL